MILALLVLALTQAEPRTPQAPLQSPVRDARPTPTGSGSIRGRVVAADTGEPIRDCRVILLAGDVKEAHPQPASARTREDGRFEFNQLAAGTYRLVAAPAMDSPRYITSSYGGSNPFSGKPIDLAPKQVVEGVEIKLLRAGVLAGRVVNEFGDPMAFVRVRALRPTGKGEPQQVGGLGNTTDDLGRFRLFGLSPGDYLLLAEPQQRVPMDDQTVLPYLPTYLPSSLTLGEASIVRLKTGQEVGELEIRLSPGRTYRITGSIMTSEGEPFSVRSGQVMLMQRTAEGGISASSVLPREDGTFEVRHLKPGTYQFEVRRHRYDEPPDGAEFAAVTIAVVDSDVEGVSVVTRPGAWVPGEVVFDEPPGELSGPLDASALVANRLESGPPLRTPVAPDGTFLLKGLFRPVYIRVSAPKGYHLASVTFEGHDITNTPTEFKHGTTGKLVATLTRRSSELSGQIHDARGRPGAGYVLAFGEDRALWSPFATTTKYAAADAKGGYKLMGLLPGRYLVVAMPSPSPAMVMHDWGADAWEALAKDATPVTIGDQERKTLDLKLIAERDR